MIKPIAKNVRIFDSVYGRLRDAILSRQLKAGEALSVPELARRLGVSRSPVREAVQQLVADGLCSSTPRKGAVVACPDGDDLLALHDIRELMEGLAARRAAAKVNARELTEMRTLLNTQKSAVTRGDADLYKETDRDFHRRIADINGESHVTNMLRVLRDQMRLAVSVALTDPDHLRKGHSEHLAVLKALAAGSPAKAEQAMRLHIAASRGRVAKRLKTSVAASDLGTRGQSAAGARKS